MDYSTVAFPCNGNQSEYRRISSDPRVVKIMTVDEIRKEEGGISDVRYCEVE